MGCAENKEGVPQKANFRPYSWPYALALGPDPIPPIQRGISPDRTVFARIRRRSGAPRGQQTGGTVGRGLET